LCATPFLRQVCQVFPDGMGPRRGRQPPGGAFYLVLASLRTGRWLDRPRGGSPHHGPRRRPGGGENSRETGPIAVVGYVELIDLLASDVDLNGRNSKPAHGGKGPDGGDEPSMGSIQATLEGFGPGAGPIVLR